MNNKVLICIYFFLLTLYGLSQNFPLKLCLSVQDLDHSKTQYCEDWVSVKDEKPSADDLQSFKILQQQL